MSISRLNTLCMSDIVPFNFGMDYQAWLNFYDNTSFRELCPENPRSWSQETIDRVNQTAKEENELVDRFMALSNEDFRAEVQSFMQKKDVNDG